MLYKRDNFTYYASSPSKKRSTLKDLLPTGANSFLLEKTLLYKGDNFFNQLPPLKVYQSLKVEEYILTVSLKVEDNNIFPLR